MRRAIGSQKELRLKIYAKHTYVCKFTFAKQRLKNSEYTVMVSRLCEKYVGAYVGAMDEN